LEHRFASPLQQARDCGQSRLLLRRRLRDFARLRFSHRVGDLLLCLARAEARPNPRLRWFRPAAEDRGHYTYEGHRDALEAYLWQARLRVGYRDGMRARCET